LNEALGRQAAHRALWDRLNGRVPIPDELAGEFSARSAANVSADAQERAVKWLVSDSPAEIAFMTKLKSADFQLERDRYAKAWRSLFTSEFNEAIARLRDGDHSGTEFAIAFIEADPWCYHSGYLKQKLARYLRRTPLTEAQRRRLRKAILAAFTKGKREDLKEYVSLSRRIDSEQFRRDLRKLEMDADEGTRVRAARALAACRMNDLPGKDLRGGA